MNRKPRKGDRVRFTGWMAFGVTYQYPPGTVVGFRDYGRVVTVELDSGGFADWPISEVEFAP